MGSLIRRGTTLAVLLLGGLVAADAQQVPPPYNNGAVCVFALLVEGYTLPVSVPNAAADPRFHFDHVEPAPPYGDSDLTYYTYKDTGIEGSVIGTKDGSLFFLHVRFDASRLPPDWRTKQEAMSGLSVQRDMATQDDVSLGCDAITVDFHFHGEPLLTVEISKQLI